MSSKCDNFESEEALKIAKTNVEKYYAVVGILERWQESLQLLEVHPCSYIQKVFSISDSIKIWIKISNLDKNRISELNQTSG